MTKLLAFLLLFLPSISFGQYNYGFLKESFFNRVPSARAEAMGKSYSSIDGDLASVFFNPAGTATIQGIEVNSSFASPLYLLDDAKYSFIAAGFKLSDYLVIALSRNHLNMGDIVYTNITGNVIGESEFYTSIYTATLSSQPLKNLYVGLNTNYLISKPLNDDESSIYFDFGAIKKFEFAQKENSEHSINIGASIINFSYASMKWDLGGTVSESEFPVITRFGANYQFSLDKHVWNDSLTTLKFLVQGEYQDVLNSDYESAIRVGSEILILEIIALRVGYYRETEHDYNYPEYNKDHITGITYGFGLQVPLYKLKNVPLNINLDYTSLPQVSHTHEGTWENFSTYTMRLTWVL